jgi:hypothetical protein
MSELDEAFDALLGLREALAGYLPNGVQLEPATLGLFVAVLDAALDAWEVENKERAFDELIRKGSEMLGQKAAEVHLISTRPNVVRFRRRQNHTTSFNGGGDAA